MSEITQIDDGDGVDDGADAFPLDSAEWLDTDGDGMSNFADLTTPLVFAKPIIVLSTTR